MTRSDIIELTKDFHRKLKSAKGSSSEVNSMLEEFISRLEKSDGLPTGRALDIGRVIKHYNSELTPVNTEKLINRFIVSVNLTTEYNALKAIKKARTICDTLAPKKSVSLNTPLQL